MTRNRHPGKPAAAAVTLPVTAAALALSALTLSLSGCTGEGGRPAPGGTGSPAIGATATGSSGTGIQGTSTSAPGRPAASSPVPASPRAPEVRSRVEGLQIPWAMVFLPNGTAVISERDSAQLKSVRDGRVGTIGAVPGVVPGGEGGLLGLALSPGFAADHYLYAYFTAADDNRIARMRLEGAGAGAGAGGELRLGEPEVIFSGISKASTHNGGRIRFGPDGFLYVGTGDSQRREQPQDRNALGGKILRLTKDGAPAPGNPSRTTRLQPWPSERAGPGVGRPGPALGERVRPRRQ